MSRFQLRIRALDSQRNGVRGEGFYTCLFDYKEGKDKGEGFIATFQTDEDDKKIIISSCRVVDPNNIKSHWRGDEFAHEIQKELEKFGKTTIYDFIEQDITF